MVDRLAALILTAGAFLAGSSKRPETKMQGTCGDSKQRATLSAAPDKLIGSGGPLTITADCKIVNVEWQ